MHRDSEREREREIREITIWNVAEKTCRHAALSDAVSHGWMGWVSCSSAHGEGNYSNHIKTILERALAGRMHASSEKHWLLFSEISRSAGAKWERETTSSLVAENSAGFPKSVVFAFLSTIFFPEF